MIECAPLFWDNHACVDVKKMKLRSTEKFYRVDRKKIGFIKFIIEACDGIAMFSTLDAGMGIVKFAVPPGCEDAFEQVMADLGQKIRIEPWQNPAPLNEPQTGRIR